MDIFGLMHTELMTRETRSPFMMYEVQAELNPAPKSCELVNRYFFRDSGSCRKLGYASRKLDSLSLFRSIFHDHSNLRLKNLHRGVGEAVQSEWLNGQAHRGKSEGEGKE